MFGVLSLSLIVISVVLAWLVFEKFMNRVEKRSRAKKDLKSLKDMAK